MIKWFCKFCGKRREEERDDIIMKVCGGCQEEMIKEVDNE